MIVKRFFFEFYGKGGGVKASLCRFSTVKRIILESKEIIFLLKFMKDGL